jgi:hypothetical protein
MRKPNKAHYRNYVQGLKALQKVMAICQKHGIYYYAASVHELPSLIIEPNDAQLDAIFSITRINNEDCHWIYIDVEGIEVRLVI